MRKGLGYHNRRSPFGFNPGTLFAGGAAGTWYDPSDASTLFSDTAGTTPCATPGGGTGPIAVGLMLDKSQGLALGSELVTNGEFSNGLTGWNVLSEGTITPTLSIVGGALQTTYTTVIGAGRAGAYQAITTVAGTWYKVSGIARHVAGTDRQASVRIGTGSGSDYANYTIIANATNVAGSTFTAFTAYFLATAASTTILLVSGGTGFGGTFTDQFDNLSVQSLAGNHAIRYGGTTTAPELSARVNLLTYSEQFDNAAWTTTGPASTTYLGTGSAAVITANYGVAPNGTNTADRVQLALNGGTTSTDRSGFAQLNVVTTVSGLSYTTSIYVKPLDSTTSAQLLNSSIGLLDSSGGGATQSIEQVGNGYFKITRTVLGSGSAHSFRVQINGAQGVNTMDLLVWGAQLIATNAFPANTYQRIADQYTYDSNGFPRYLKFDGADDGMYTPANLNLGTDKATVFAGVRKLSDAASGVVTELSADTATNNGAFVSAAPGSAGANSYQFQSRGTAVVTVGTGVTNVAPITNVVTSLGNISGDSAIIRVNGTQAASSTADQGTGNYGTYPLYIGSRNSASLWFNGYIYSLLVVGSSLSAAQISSTESWIAGKEGITL